MIPETLLYIDGEWRAGRTERTQPVVSPASDEAIGVLHLADIEDLDKALASSHRAFQSWREVPAVERSAILSRAAALLRERAAEIAPILTQEQGKPLGQSHAEIASSADVFDWFAGEARRAYGRIIPARAPGVTSMAAREPVGPVAAFTPWNFPIAQLARKLGPGLAAGCTLIVKPPEDTPASPAALVRALVDAGLPKGVVNMVYGDPATVSGYLIPHPVIRKLSFTGSVPVGKLLAALAGTHMKRATLELGGHSPVIVCDDADVGAAAAMMAGMKSFNAGQVCISPTRFLVQDRAHDEFMDVFARQFGGNKVGDGLAADTTMGPLVSTRRQEAVEALVQDAVEHGAKAVTGGARVGNKGAFFAPTVLSGVDASMRIMNEEPFGPVALVSRFSAIDDAITEANRLPYGLAAYAFTGSMRTAGRLSNEVETGMMTVNHLGIGPIELPFGGVKDSGYGSEGGVEAMDAYLNSKLVTQSWGNAR